MSESVHLDLESELQPLNRQDLNSDSPPASTAGENDLTSRLRSFNDTEGVAIISREQALLSEEECYCTHDRQQCLNTKLAIAVGRSQYMNVKKLLDAGANPNATCDKLKSVCHAAALVDKRILSLLLERGAEKRRFDSYGRSPLHYAAWAGNISNLRLLLVNQDRRDLDIRCDYTIVIQELPKDWQCKKGFDYGLYLPSSFLFFGIYVVSDCTPLHAASICAHEKAVRFLLDLGADPDLRDCKGNTPLGVAGKEIRSEKNFEEEFSEVVRSLLRHTKHKEISDMESIITTAIRLKSEESVEALLYDARKPYQAYQLYLFAFSTATKQNNREMVKYFIINDGVLNLSVVNNKFSKTLMQQIIDDMRKPTEFLEELFDSCIMKDTRVLVEDFAEVIMTYRILVPNQDQRRDKRDEIENTGNEHIIQMKVIQSLLNTGNEHGQKKLLIHPLVESFIYLKWRAILPFYCTMLAFFLLFTVLLTCYILSEFYYNDKNTDIPTWLNKTALIVAVYVFNTLTVCLEIPFYLNSSIKQQILRIEFWIKCISLVLSLILPIVFKTSSGTNLSRHLASTALLLCWMEMTLLISRFPKWGHYVLMFWKVATKVLKILLMFSCLLIGFALCFMIQFHSKDQFDNPWAAFVKTIVMMTSEFDYDDLIENNEGEDLNNSLIMIRLIFLMFLILVAIALMNLMTGVAVDDLNGLKVFGNMMTLEKQAEFLSSLESKVFNNIMPKTIKRNLSLPRDYYISLIPNTKYYNRIIPSRIEKAIFEIANSNYKKYEEHKKMETENLSKQEKEIASDYLRKDDLTITQMKNEIDNISKKLDLLTSQLSGQPV